MIYTLFMLICHEIVCDSFRSYVCYMTRFSLMLYKSDTQVRGKVMKLNNAQLNTLFTLILINSFVFVHLENPGVFSHLILISDK